MTTHDRSAHAEGDMRALHDEAYEAMDRGELDQASRLFEALLEHDPGNPGYHYMRGLAHKYQMDWATSLHHNLQAIELEDENNEAQHWNAAIAATALGEWAQARKLWTACGIRLPDGEGPIDADFGVAVVRLNPWHGGETVFMRRIDPVRGRLLNVPLPESGHRFGDIVLHDGARTGGRLDGEHEVPVFNELQRLVPSSFQTYVAFVGCERREDLEALRKTTGPGIGHSEDWTDGIVYYCMRCSYSTPHRHDTAMDHDGWQPDRNLGIAAQSRLAVEKLLHNWASAAPGRRIDGIETRECRMPDRQECHAWWRGPEEEPSGGS
jgi:tetratricopeptide (TPR) repeat protein